VQEKTICVYRIINKRWQCPLILPLSDVVPTIAPKHLLDLQGIDIQHAYLQKAQRQHASSMSFWWSLAILLPFPKKMNPWALFQSSTTFNPSLISRRSSMNWK
jgi:hypothetical protein